MTWYKPPTTKLQAMPVPNNENGTKIEYRCKSRRHFFNYPYPQGQSFYYTENIDSIDVMCTKEGYVN